jgi:hypothetical protein
MPYGDAGYWLDLSGGQPPWRGRPSARARGRPPGSALRAETHQRPPQAQHGRKGTAGRAQALERQPCSITVEQDLGKSRSEGQTGRDLSARFDNRAATKISCLVGQCFQMMGVFAEFERAMIRERVLAGLARAKEQGISLGRRRLEDSDAAKVAAIKRALAAKRGVRRIARDLETGVGTVLRIKNELAA